MRTIHVNSTEQTEILQMTKEKIQSLESNINKKQNAMTMGLSKEKRKN